MGTARGGKGTQSFWCLWKYMLISRVFYFFICREGQLRNLFRDRLSWICYQTNTMQIRSIRMFSSLLILQGIRSTSRHSGRFPVLVVGSQFHRTRLSRRTPIPASVLAYVAERQPSDTRPPQAAASHTRIISTENHHHPSTVLSKEWPYCDWTSQGCGI